MKVYLISSLRLWSSSFVLLTKSKTSYDFNKQSTHLPIFSSKAFLYFSNFLQSPSNASVAFSFPLFLSILAYHSNSFLKSFNSSSHLLSASSIDFLISVFSWLKSPSFSHFLKNSLSFEKIQNVKCKQVSASWSKMFVLGRVSFSYLEDCSLNTSLEWERTYSISEKSLKTPSTSIIAL